ncbi:MAG: DUF975 family protein [Negativibacillus sp.]
MNARPRWDRPTLKQYAKTALKNFYWKAVLASLIFSILGGGLGASSGRGTGTKTIINGDGLNLDHNFFNHDSLLFSSIAIGIFIIIFLLAFALGLVYGIFVAGPMEVGHNRFYLESRSNPTGIGRLFYAFSCGNYGNVVKTMFLRNLYIFLWSLLFVIPGIVKSYQYRMVPYILAENPNISADRAFELSKQMMDGRKWDLFIFDWSFFCWELLAGILIIGGIFLKPYIQAANAEVYLWLRYDALYTGYADSRELNGLFMDPPEYTQY